MKATSEQVLAGQAVYTKRTLAAYDLVVLGISNRFIWKCPTGRILDHYNRNISVNHLDVGIGSGYFLDRCQFPSQSPRIVLMDLNSEALDYAANRISRYHPAVYCRNVLEPISLEIDPFDSIGINYLLHCLPGSIEEKSMILDHLKPLMRPGAVVFGSTLLQGDVSRNWAARQLMRIYNGKGIFCNQHDHLAGLTRALQTRLGDVSVEVAGCGVLFAGRL